MLVLLALVAGWKGDRLHPLYGNWEREGGEGDPHLPAPKRSRRRMGRCAGARAPELVGVQLRRREALVRLPWSGLRPEGGCAVRAGEVFPVPPLLRPHLREPAGERDAPCSSPGADDTGEARW